jgi:hypothetical protein
MASPTPGFPISSDALEQWRAAGGERLTYSEVGWTGTAVALVAHATLHFFSVVISALDPLLAAFALPEHFAFALTKSSAPIARWLVLEFSVAAFGALVGIGLLALVHEATDLARRALDRHR